MTKEKISIMPIFASPAMVAQLDLDLEKLTEFAEVKKLTESAEFLNFTTEFMNYINKLNQTTDLKKVKVLFMIVPFILMKISKCFLKSYQY